MDTLYKSTLEHNAKFSPLYNNAKCQTCVIGGGFAGLTAARELTKKGHDVVLVEAKQIGYGASGRNAGFVSAGFARPFNSIVDKVGMDQACELFKLSMNGREYVRNTIDELDSNSILLGRGWLTLLRHANRADVDYNRKMMTDKFGINWQLISNPDLQQFVRSKKYQSGLLDNEAFHIHPLNYAYALARDIVDNGANIYEQTKCVAVEKNSNNGQYRWRVGCGKHHVDAENVVLATSVYGGPYEKLNRSMIPVATYIVSSSNCSDELERLIPYKGCISDTRRSGDYYRAVEIAGRRKLIWGGRITTFRNQPARLAAMLKSDIVSTYPQLHDIQIDHAWSGLMGYTRSKMPIITQISTGLWAATAFGGQGINTSAMAGQLISAAIVENDDRYRLFEPFAITWSGSIFGQIGTQMEYWRLQLLDKWDERGVSRN